MGQILCCCSRSSTPQPSANESHHLSTSSLTDSESSRSQSMHNMTLHDVSQCERHHPLSFQGQRARDVEPSPPALECFIIPSFGEDPPDNVAVKLKITDKMANNFLEGVGKDFNIIQQLIKEDDTKQLLEVRLMCHFAQKKVKEFKKAIGDAMKCLKLKHTQKGCKYNKYLYLYVIDHTHTITCPFLIMTPSLSIHSESLAVLLQNRIESYDRALPHIQ